MAGKGERVRETRDMFNRCQRAKENGVVYRWYNSQAAFEKYNRAQKLIQ